MLNPSDLDNLLTAHCRRVIDSMSLSELWYYALSAMRDSFDTDPGQGNTNLTLLVTDIHRAEGGDVDSTTKFIAGKVGNELADEILKTIQLD